MEQQPPEDVSALTGGMNELQTQIKALQNDISNLRLDLSAHKRELQTFLQGVSDLTPMSNIRYSHGNPMQSQDQSGVDVQITSPIYGTQLNLGADKDSPPLVPQGTELSCVRCGYTWTPHARRPRQCAKCRAPWWFPPRWKWHQSGPQSQ